VYQPGSVDHNKPTPKAKLIMQYKLTLIDNLEGAEKVEWEFQPPASIGRSSEADISIPHPSISRRHCLLFLHSDGSLAIKDLNSLNGTYVGDDRIKETVLMPGAQFQLGAVTLRVEWTYDTKEDIVDSRKADMTATQRIRIIRGGE
jgi:pSer/pThr/pTyr-binding forkhead associated (FHA) protein